MRKQLFLIIVLLMSLSLIAQESNKGDNTIIIQTEDNYDNAFRNMGQLFVQNGLTIDNADKDFGTITTREIRIGSRLDPLWEMKVTAIVSGYENAKITLTAMAKGENSSWETMDKRGKLHMFGKGWEKMEELAKKYPDATIKFENRE